ncbi:MAG: glycosyltransferase [Pelagibacteraceae bacterium]|nr:glycosyltransferase [Pelagibacteraceae bacterium]MCI5078829.1 glycosyltransferase [Pelagibacteraceae bacterium]
MINILLINNIDDSIYKIETIKDFIQPIENNPNFNFEHIIGEKFLKKIQNNFNKTIKEFVNKFDIIFFDPNCLNFEVIKNIYNAKDQVKLVGIFHECFGHYDNYYKFISPYVDYFVVQELRDEFYLNKKNKIIFDPLIVCNKHSVFNFSGENKSIDFYFSGTISTDRKYTLAYLKKNLNCTFEIGGGRYNGDQSFDVFLKKIKKAKSSIAFPSNKRRFIDEFILDTKNNLTSWSGRVPHCLAFETLIFSRKFREFEIFFRDKVDYISYISDTDLIKKIHYYCKNNDHRNHIVKNAKKRFLEITSEAKFEKISKKIIRGEKFYIPVCKSNYKLYNFIFLIPYYKIILPINSRVFFMKFYKFLAMLYHGQFKKLYDKLKSLN